MTEKMDNVKLEDFMVKLDVPDNLLKENITNHSVLKFELNVF